MASLNKIMMIGNLCRDPEIRMAGDSKVASFSIAVNEKYKGRDGQSKEKTEYINVVFWGRQAEICEQYLRKGASIFVEGKLETRSWDDKNTGEKKYKTEVRGVIMQMLGGAKSAPDGGSAPTGNDLPPEPEPGLPF
jgi:single-strand DNA-binding protein